MSTTGVSTTSTSTSANSALQQAAQSIISGSTGNSSMDVNSLVTALVNAKTAGQSGALTAKQTSDKTQISALGTLSSALSALQAGLSSLSDGTMLSKFSATASGSGLTATAGAGAAAGSYSINVAQIATSQSLTSGGFNATKALGTGTLTIGLGSQSMNVTIDGSNNTLSGIAAAINSASGNPGVTAAVITDSSGNAHLMLNSSSTGAANVINVSVGNLQNDAGLSSLGVTSTAGTGAGTSTITSSGAIAWTQSTAAQNASFTIGATNGIPVTSATNSVTTAISGVTLNLTSAAVGTTQTLTVAKDTSSQATAITNFVNLYNTLVTTMTTLSSFDKTQSASAQGPLLGDSTLNTIRNTLGSVVSNGVRSGNTSTSLASIGITLQADGTLQTDTTKLNSALQNNPTTITTLFASGTGVAAQLNTDITSYVSSTGIIATRTAALNKDLTSISTQQTALSAYAAQLTSQYQAQFTALNTLMATMNNNQQYLTQLFGGSNSQGAMSANKG
ncbi:flagellar filament capping protein FliD [Burkholderia sp. Bp9143]|uniref:flagellar filament capping protein FliD n=1 Tax=Burkholderia sp. Bp9143 TaxID=2184574 RepID=UPI003908ABAD